LNRQSYEDLQDKQLLSEAINEPQTVTAVGCEDGYSNSIQIEGQQTGVEQDEIEQFRGITDYLLEVHN
jgi:hypothetical protein